MFLLEEQSKWLIGFPQAVHALSDYLFVIILSFIAIQTELLSPSLNKPRNIALTVFFSWVATPSEAVDSVFLRNGGIYRRVYMAPEPRRTYPHRLETLKSHII
jgi:hypothetical protein